MLCCCFFYCYGHFRAISKKFLRDWWSSICIHDLCHVYCIQLFGDVRFCLFCTNIRLIEVFFWANPQKKVKYTQWCLNSVSQWVCFGWILCSDIFPGMVMLCMCYKALQFDCSSKLPHILGRRDVENEIFWTQPPVILQTFAALTHTHAPLPVQYSLHCIHTGILDRGVGAFLSLPKPVWYLDPLQLCTSSPFLIRWKRSRQYFTVVSHFTVMHSVISRRT